MPHATVLRPSAAPAPARSGSPDARTADDTTARDLADAVAEFDAALAEGRPMIVLARLDREVTAATRRHRAALAAVLSA